jgi:hypothetical protein
MFSLRIISPARFNREKCKQIIANAGLPVPVKSAWWFCPASKKHEISWLREHHPELLERALEIDRNARRSSSPSKVWVAPSPGTIT